MEVPEDSEGKSQSGKEDIWVFRLYIARSAPNSMLAINNMDAILEEYLKGQYELTIIDILESPLQALQEDVFAAPTLLKISPPPIVKIVGSLSDREQVLAGLGLQERQK